MDFIISSYTPIPKFLILSFPKKRISARCRGVPRKPWMTYCLARSCNTKSKLYKKFVRFPTRQNKDKYVTYRNKLKTWLRKAEHSYYKEQFERHKNNLSLVWRTIKRILYSNQKSDIIDCINVNGHKITDKSSMAQKFNEYFTNIGPSLAEKIPAVNCSHMSYLKGDFKDSFSLFHTCNNRVVCHLVSLQLM